MLFLLGWLAVGFAGATPALAHAELLTSSPTSGAALDAAPTELTLTFSESITQVPGAMKLIAADGTAAPLGRTTVEGNTLHVPIPGPLPDAGYVFVFRVISADSHPVAGAITFTLGETATSASAAAVADAVGGGSDAVVSAVAGVNRWSGYGGVILLIGVPTFNLLCRRDSVDDAAADPLLRGLTLGGGALVALTALASLPLQGARSGGTGLAGGFGEIDTVLETAYGQAALGRLAVVVLVLAALAAAVRWPSARLLALNVAGVAAVAVLITAARSGHPAVGKYPALTMLVDAVHFGAVAVWIGGLVVLAVRLLPHPPADCRAVLARWSPVAMWAVAVLAVTGSIQAWRELRSIDAFVDSEYGRWILAKAVGLVLLIGLGEVGRRRVRAINVVEARPLVSASLGAALADEVAKRPDEVRTLRRSVGLELALAAAVLAATSALVVTTPGVHSGHDGMANMAGMAGMAGMDMEGHSSGSASHSEAGSESPVTAPVELPNDVRVEIVADPARVGSAVLTITIRSLSGDLVDPPEVNLTASLAEAGISPITLTPVRVEAGRFTVDAGPMLLAGTWKVTVTVRTTETDAGVGSVEIPLARA
ncbi:copper resistance protein CopC [Sporichthya sp.]|uniref:copper resistance CopC/CopD family protein n=1 Tax=Sporichthya sp. TaxID=65475 RepID=UPI0025FAC915|nr:copper resistance protein CopC [Sporichthya sp.]